MKKGVFLVLAFAALILCSCSGDKPTTKDLKTALIETLPGFVELEDFKIKASQNFGNEVDPNYGSRFQAEIVTVTDLYKKDAVEHNVQFIHLSTTSGKKMDIFGKIQSALYQGSWKHDVQIDGNPIQNLGIPLNQFSSIRCIVRGSVEETDFYSEIKRKEEERIAAEAKKAEELRNNIRNAENLFIGSWRAKHGLFKRNSDGTYTYKFDNGGEAFGNWYVEGDYLMTIQKGYKEFRGEGKEPKIRYEKIEQKYIITYIDKNNYSIKLVNSGDEYSAVRIE